MARRSKERGVTMSTPSRKQLWALRAQLPEGIYKYIRLMLEVNDETLAERQRQNEKWGTQRHGYGRWLAILGEEFGEVCEALGPLMGLETGKDSDADDPYEELIQLAAVAQAIAEQIKEERGTPADETTYQT